MWCVCEIQRITCPVVLYGGYERPVICICVFREGALISWLLKFMVVGEDLSPRDRHVIGQSNILPSNLSSSASEKSQERKSRGEHDDVPPISQLGPQCNFPESITVSSSGTFEWGDMGDALDGLHNDGVSSHGAPLQSASQNSTDSICLSAANPAQDAAACDKGIDRGEGASLSRFQLDDKSNASARLNGCSESESKSSRSPVPGQSADSVMDSRHELELNGALEGELAAVTQGADASESLPASSCDNFYREIYFSPERQEEVGRLLKSLPRGEEGTLILERRHTVSVSRNLSRLFDSSHKERFM